MEKDRPTMADFLLLLSKEEVATSIVNAPVCPVCEGALVEDVNKNTYCSVCKERERINHIAQMISV